MKKFFYFAMIALVGVAFASCKGNDPDKDAAYQIEVSDVTATTATIKVTPKTVGETYYWDIMPKEEYDAIVAGEYADEGFADIPTYCTENISYVIQIYEMMGYQVTWADMVYDDVDEYTYEELVAETEYVVYALPANVEKEECSAPVVTKVFKTTEFKELGQVDVKFVQPEWYDFVADEGWWQVMAAESKDTAYFVSLSPVKCSQVEGTYTLDDMDEEYSNIYDEKNGGSSAFIDLTVNITKEKGMYVIKANGLATNGYRYNMTFDPIDPDSAIKDFAPARNTITNKASKKSFRAVEFKKHNMGLNLLKK